MNKIKYKTMFGIIKKMFIVLLTSMVNASNHKKCVFLSNQICEIQPTFINLHPMNTVKNYITLQLQLNQIEVLEVVIFLMTYLINYVFQIKQKIQTYVFKLQEKRIKNFNKDISCKCKCKFDGKKMYFRSMVE